MLWLNLYEELLRNLKFDVFFNNATRVNPVHTVQSWKPSKFQVLSDGSSIVLP